MVCAKKRQAKEGSHAFTERFYRIGDRGSSMGIAAAFGCAIAQGPRPGVHGCGRMELGPACGGTRDLGVCSVPRSGQGTFPASGVQCDGRRAATNSDGPGKTSQRSVDRRGFPPLAAACLANGNRLAPGALLRRAAAQSQRDLLRQNETRHLSIPRVCHRMHRSVWRTLHAGTDLDSTPRDDRCRAEAFVDADSRNWPENRAFAAGSSFFQLPGNGVSEGRTARLFDASDVPRTPAQEATRSWWAPLDQATKRWLVSPHDEAWHPVDHRQSLCRVSHLPPPQNQETRDAKAAVRCVARAWLAHRNSRTLPRTLRHRVELSAAPPSADLHLHAEPPLAARVRRSGLDPAQSVGLDPRDDLGRRPRRLQNAPSGTLAFQTNA